MWGAGAGTGTSARGVVDHPDIDHPISAVGVKFVLGSCVHTVIARAQNMQMIMAVKVHIK